MPLKLADVGRSDGAANSITTLLLGVFVNVWPHTKRSMQLPKNIAELLIVDVLIPTYNESNEIICTTITAATQMEYSQDRLRVHICDDGGTLYKNAVSPIQWQRTGCAIMS